MAFPKPSPKDIVDALQALTDDEITKLFHHLSIPLHNLTNIKTNHGGTFTIHCVDEWFKVELDVSWEKIIAGLRHIGLRVLAEQVATQHHIETSAADDLTSDPITTPVSAQDSDIMQSPVTSESNPVQLPASTTHPATVTLNSAPSDPVLPSALTNHSAIPNDPFQQVREEIEQLEDSFASMISMTRSALCKKESEDSKFIEEFRDYLLFLPLSKKAPHAKFFDREDDIRNAKTIQELLEFLRNYCDYSNYNLLLRLIKKFCNAAEKERMQDYCKLLERFEKATPINVYLVAISASGEILLEFSKIVMKMKKRTSQCTLHDVRKFKEDLCETAFLPSYSVSIKGVDEGCVEVVLCFPPDCVGWILAALTPAFLRAHDVTDVFVDGQSLRIKQEDKDKLISTDEDPASHVTEGPPSSTVTDKMSGDDPVPESGLLPQITDQITADEEYARQLQRELDVMSDEPDTNEMSGGVDPAHHVPESGPPPQITDQISADEEYARQLQHELDVILDELDRGGEVTVPLHREQVPVTISEEEDPAGHVMEDPSRSTVTDPISEDVDPAHHVPDSGPPPQITDQISADEEYARQLQSQLDILLDVSDTISGDEELARQLQFELDAISGIQDRLHGDLKPSMTESHVESYLGIHGTDDSQIQETPQDVHVKGYLAEKIEYARQLLLQLDLGILDDDVPDDERKLTETIDGQLGLASIAGDVVRVASLLNSGADVEIRMDDGNNVTPLQLASGCGHLQTVRLLLQRGAKVDSLAADGSSALQMAAWMGKTDVVIELVKNGANLNFQNESGLSALQLSALVGNTDAAVELIKNGANLNLQDESGMSALQLAAMKGRTDVVIELVKNGANLNFQNEDGSSALQMAAGMGKTDVVIELVKNGANLNLQNTRGDSAVILATVKHQSGALLELVNIGANLNLQNQEGLTALMISARNGETELTDILLTGENIDPDIQENNTGWSALFFSAERGDVTTTKSLLKAGANAHLRDRNGLTALDVATNSDKGYAEGVCELLHKCMLESATAQSHHDDAGPPSGTGSTSGQESDQDRPSAGDDIDGERDTTSTSGRGLPETLRNLANTSSQTVRRLFDGLERRLKSTDKKVLFYIGGAGVQQRPQRNTRRGQNTQTDSSTKERVLFMSPPNI